MSNFKTKFAIQFILGSLIMGIIFGLIGNIATGVLYNVIKPEGTGVCYIITITSYVFDAIAVIFAVLISQNTLKKKSYDNYPDSPMKFYLILAGIVTAVSVLWSIIFYPAIYNTCVENLDTLEMTLNLDSDKFATTDSVVDEVKRLAKTAVRIAEIIGNIVFAAIAFLMAPVYAKRHENFF